MSELQIVRVQLLNPQAENQKEDVDVFSCAKAIKFTDGQDLQQKFDSKVLQDNTELNKIKEELETKIEKTNEDVYISIEATGTNDYICMNNKMIKLTKGTKCTLFVDTDSTGNCTLSINNFGVKNIKDSNGNIIINLKADIPYNLCYNGTDFILQGKGGGGNLIPRYLLEGYHGEGDNGKVDGIMINKGEPSRILNCGEIFTIEEGYYSGGNITANSLISQTSADATINDIKSGKTAWVNGNKITGISNDSLRFSPGETTTLFSSKYSYNGPITNKKVIEATIFNQGGTVTVSYDINIGTLSGYEIHLTTCIYKNDVKYGEEYVDITTENNTIKTYSQNVDISPGDKIQLYIITYSFTETSTCTFDINNFNIKCGNVYGYIK